MFANNDRVYSPAEAARLLGVTPARVRQFMAAGRLPYIRTPLGRLLDADAVDAMVQARAHLRHPEDRDGEA